MSNLTMTLTITPPQFRTGGSTGESYSVGGYDCTYCRGKGVFTNEIGKDEEEEKICPVCRGAKTLRAMVAIKWVPEAELL